MSRQVSAERLDSPDRILGSNFRATNLDLVLATIIALGLPFACQWLFDHTGGALTSLLLYYGVCCVAVVWWRKGTLDYRWPQRWPWLIFIPSLLVPLAISALNYGSLPDYHAPVLGFVLTILIWVPLNAAMEQLCWFYVLDAWRNRWHCVVGRTGNSYPPAILGAFLANIKAYTLFVARHSSQPSAHCILCCIVLPFRLDVSNLFYPSAGRPATCAACPLCNLALSDISRTYPK